MVEEKKTASLRYKIISNMLLITVSTTTFFSQPKFIKPFSLNNVMAEAHSTQQKKEKPATINDIIKEMDVKIQNIANATEDKKQKLDDAINYFNKNKSTQEFVEGFLEKFRNIALSSIKNKNDYEKFSIYAEIIIKTKFNKNEDFKNEVNNIFEQIKKDYPKIYNEYEKYCKNNKKEIKLTGFLTDVNNIRENGEGYPTELVNAVKSIMPKKEEPKLAEIVPVPTIPIPLTGTGSKIEGKANEIKSIIDAAKQRIEHIGALLENLEKFVRVNVERRSQEKLLNIIAEWKKKLEKFDNGIKNAGAVFKKETYSKEDVEKINKIPQLFVDIENFMRNELVLDFELRRTKQYAYYLIAAIVSGTERDYIEAQKLKGAIENMKTIAPKKYEFCINLINSFVKNVSPDIYDVLNNLDAANAFQIAKNAVLTAKREEHEKLKNIYGSDFVEYVSQNKEKINEKTYEEEVKNKLLQNFDVNSPLANSFAFLEQIRILRNKLTFIITSNESSENVTLNIESWFDTYKKMVGNNLSLMKLFYDLDLLAEDVSIKKPQNAVEAKEILVKVFKYLEQNKTAIPGAVTNDAITKFYLIKIGNDLAPKHNLDTKAIEAMNNALILVEKTDSYLLPAFYQDVIMPLAKVLEGRSMEFSEALTVFSGMFAARYPLDRTKLSFLILDTQKKFKTVFKWFKENIPEVSKKMTHYELMDETRERGELTEYEVYPPYNLYAQRASIWHRPAQVSFPYITPLYGVDFLPNPQMQYPAQMPYGPLLVNTDAEGLHLKLDNQLNPFIPYFGRPALTADFRVTAVSRAVMLATIRKAFGQVSMYSPDDIIALAGEAGGYYRLEKDLKTTETEKGLRGMIEARYPVGGLIGTMMGVGREREGKTAPGIIKEKSEEYVATLTGGGVGPIISVADRLDFTSTESENAEKNMLNAIINQLTALSKENGQSLLVYIPELVIEKIREKKETWKETTEERLGGKIYYINPNGDIYQLAVGHNEYDMFKKFLYGSVEKENVLASMRKYGQWTDTEFGNFGGAFGFTIDTIAAFTMEDAIRRIGTAKRQEYNEDLKKNITVVDFNKLEPVGYSAIPLAMAFNTLENGTLAFITRLSVPTTVEKEGKREAEYKKGIYNLEMIIRNVKPAKEYEIRVMGGWPGDVGALLKYWERKEGKETMWFAKASTATYLLYQDLFAYEREIESVVKYVRTTMAEIYKWDEHKKNIEGYFVGATLMNAAISETMEKYVNLSDMGWDNTYFSIVASYYMKKFGVFSGFERTPGYGNQINQISQLIEQRRAEMLQYPERAEQITKLLDDEIKRMADTKFWKPIVGVQWDPETFTVRLIGRGEIAEYKKEGVDLGYSWLGGNMFVGYKRGIEPYFELSTNTLRYNQNAYLDFLFALGAAKVKFAPASTFVFESQQGISDVSGLVAWVNNNKRDIINKIFTKYYALEPSLSEIETYIVELANNLNKEKKEQLNYYILFDKGNKKIVIGNESDREEWMKKGLEVGNDFFLLRIGTKEGKTIITIETANVSETKLFSRLKFIGGIPIIMDEKKMEKIGEFGGILADVLTTYKTQVLTALFLGKRIFENEELAQYSFVVSSKWNNINLANLQDRIYGYFVINHLTRTITVITPEEMDEIKRTTVAIGATYARFDGILGETAKLNLYIEAGYEEKEKALNEFLTNEKISGKSLLYRDNVIGRIGIGYDWKQNFFGYEGWLNFSVVGYMGYWPIATLPTNITDLRSLQLGPFERVSGGFYPYPVGLMFYVSGRY